MFQTANFLKSNYLKDNIGRDFFNTKMHLVGNALCQIINSQRTN